MLWNVYLAVRDEGGEKRTVLVGVHSLDDLPAVLPAALEQARGERGGVQLTRYRTSPVPAAPGK